MRPRMARTEEKTRGSWVAHLAGERRKTAAEVRRPASKYTSLAAGRARVLGGKERGARGFIWGWRGETGRVDFAGNWKEIAGVILGRDFWRLKKGDPLTGGSHMSGIFLFLFCFIYFLYNFCFITPIEVKQISKIIIFLLNQLWECFRTLFKIIIFEILSKCKIDTLCLI